MSECSLKRRHLCNRSEDRTEDVGRGVRYRSQAVYLGEPRKPDVSGIEKEAVVMDEGEEARLERQLKITSAVLLVSSDFIPSM